MEYAKKPYAPLFDRMYVVHHKKLNRRFAVLVSKDCKAKKTTSLARYIVETNRGEFLPKGFEVDHINNDKTDDRIENLQVITKSENIRKQLRKTWPEVHGTRRMYCKGCRCELCREYKRLVNKKYKESKLARIKTI